MCSSFTKSCWHLFNWPFQHNVKHGYEKYVVRWILSKPSSIHNIVDYKKPDLTCFYEEGIADMDLSDNFLKELEYLDNITSCIKVDYLMLSEYDQNLIKEI